MWPPGESGRSAQHHDLARNFPDVRDTPTIQLQPCNGYDFEQPRFNAMPLVVVQYRVRPTTWKATNHRCTLNSGTAGRRIHLFAKNTDGTKPAMNSTRMKTQKPKEFAK